MINPGVICLASHNRTENVKFPYRFEIEDNIGESIHIHYKDIRLDLTVKDFDVLAEKMHSIINSIVDAENFRAEDFDPVNLTGLAGSLPDLERIEFDEVYLEDILVDTFDEHGNPTLAPINNSRVYKALCGLTKESDNHAIQLNYAKPASSEKLTNHERILYNLEQIKKHGYPTNGELILISAENQIWDGQHRAACLYYLYGNIKVPVRRFVWKDTGAPEYKNVDWERIEREEMEKQERERLEKERAEHEVWKKQERESQEKERIERDVLVNNEREKQEKEYIELKERKQQELENHKKEYAEQIEKLRKPNKNKLKRFLQKIIWKPWKKLNNDEIAFFEQLNGIDNKNQEQFSQVIELLNNMEKENRERSFFIESKTLCINERLTHVEIENRERLTTIEGIVKRMEKEIRDRLISIENRL